MNSTLLFILTLIVMAAGLIGIVFPVLPSIPLIWLGVFFYGLLTDFAELTDRFLWIISGLAVATFIFDYVNVLWGARRFEVTGWAVLGAVLGGFIGSLIGVWYALIIGPVLGILLVEMLRGRDVAFSYRSGHYRVIGFIGGTIIKFVLGLTMVGLFLYQVLGPGGI